MICASIRVDIKYVSPILFIIMEDKLLNIIGLVLVGEVLIARGLFFDLEKNFNSKKESDDVKILFSMLETHFLFEENNENGLFNLKNRYRDYLLNKI